MEWFPQKVGTEGAVPRLWLQQSPQALARHPSPRRITAFLSLELGFKRGRQCWVLHGQQFLSAGARKMTVWVLWAVQEVWDGCLHSVWYLGCADLKGNPSWVLLWIRAILSTFILTSLIDKFLYKCYPSIWASDIHPFNWAIQWLSETVA